MRYAAGRDALETMETTEINPLSTAQTTTQTPQTPVIAPATDQTDELISRYTVNKVEAKALVHRILQNNQRRYLRTLPITDDLEDDLANTFGAGSYYVEFRKRGQYAGNATFEIAGEDASEENEPAAPPETRVVYTPNPATQMTPQLLLELIREGKEMAQTQPVTVAPQTNSLKDTIESLKLAKQLGEIISPKAAPTSMVELLMATLAPITAAAAPMILGMAAQRFGVKMPMLPNPALPPADDEDDDASDADDQSPVSNDDSDDSDNAQLSGGLTAVDEAKMNEQVLSLIAGLLESKKREFYHASVDKAAANITAFLQVTPALAPFLSNFLTQPPAVLLQLLIGMADDATAKKILATKNAEKWLGEVQAKVYPNLQKGE